MKTDKYRHRIAAAATAVFTAAIFISSGPGVCETRAPLSIEPVEERNTYFQGDNSTIQFSITSGQSATYRIGWIFTCKGAILARDIRQIDLRKTASQKININLRMPETDKDIILDAAIDLLAVQTENNKHKAAFSKKIWIFPKAPAAYAHSLKDNRLHLFDPGRKTADRLKRTGIPFELIEHATALADISKGLLLVGEGIASDAFASLFPLIIDRARRGISVIVLAPQTGRFPAPLIKTIDPSRIVKKGRDIISFFDSRLDGVAWQHDNRIPQALLSWDKSKERVFGVVASEAAGWPWMEINFRNSRFIYCGFKLIKCWEINPTPRYFFLHMIKYSQEKPFKVKQRGKRP